MRKERIINIIKLVKFIEKNPDTYLKEISRTLKMNPATVHRTLKDLENFIVTRAINQEVGGNLPNLPIMIRLKEGVTAEGIIRFLKIKEKIKSTE